MKSEQALFTSHNPSVYRGFRGICEEWRVKSRVGFFSRKPTPPATRKHLPNRNNSPIEIYITTHYFLPGNGTILPQLRATLCHCQAKSGISLLSNLNKAHSLMLHTLQKEWKNCFLLKFRKWFKNGLKAQKLLAQGIALGIMAISKAPCKGKSFVHCPVF